MYFGALAGDCQHTVMVRESESETASRGALDSLDKVQLLFRENGRVALFYHLSVDSGVRQNLLVFRLWQCCLPPCRTKTSQAELEIARIPKRAEGLHFAAGLGREMG